MVTFKKTLSSFGVIIICFSAMFLETLFISYKLDMDKLDISAFTLPQKVFYDAQSSMCMMMNLISLGILGLFSFVLLFFSIARYIEENRSNMGILKAMGYSSSHIALGMMKFALPTFIGCLLGYLGALGFSERFYNTMNADHIIPDFLFSFNPLVFICIVIGPALLVLLFSYIVSLLKVKGNPLVLISQKENLKRGRIPKEANDFIKELKGTILKNHISIIVFVAFSVLCFSSAVQMSFTMYHEANTSPLLFWMMFIIGMLLGITIIILAFRFVFKGNLMYMSILRAYGYNDKECYKAMYGGYHIVSIASFIIGTGYQTLILSTMFKAFSETYGIKYKFDFLGLLYTIIIFLVIYITVNIYYYKKINKLKLDNLNADLG